jgi:autotransporter-associated beta strand protein
MATITWKNPVTGDWTAASDWSISVPTSTDDAVIGQIGNYVVTITSADVANSLTFNAPGATLFETGTGSLSMAGSLAVDSGTAILDAANTIGGGVTLNGGELAVGTGAALGAGSLTINGGEFLGVSNETLPNRLIMSGSFTLAAAHGTTLDLGGAAPWVLTESTGSAIAFGTPGQDGVVVWHTLPGSTITNVGASLLKVQGGTLKAGDGSFGFLTSDVLGTIVESGGTIDLAGFVSFITALQGQGTVTDSGAATTLTLNNANFAGTLSGPLSLDFVGPNTLAGNSLYTGGTTVGAAATLTNDGLFDLTSNVGITSGGSGSSFVNNGFFEKTSGGGTSTVSTPFVNNGDIDVANGALQFTGGFTNVGIVEGVLSQSGGVTTVTANAPGQTTLFGGSGDNRFVIGAAPTYIDGGGGLNTVELTGNMVLAGGSLANVGVVQVDNGVSANLSNLALGEEIVSASTVGGSAGIIGTLGNDVIVGGAGNDFLAAGGAGTDLIVGGTGNDVLMASTGQDTMVAGSGTDFITCGSGTDGVIGGAGQDSIVAGSGTDFIQAGTGLDFVAFPAPSTVGGHFDEVTNFQTAGGGKGTFLLLPGVDQASTGFQSFNGGTLLDVPVGGSFFDIFLPGVAPSTVQAQTMFSL